MKILSFVFLSIISLTTFASDKENYSYLNAENYTPHESEIYKKSYYEHYNKHKFLDNYHLIMEDSFASYWQHPLQEECDLVALSYGVYSGDNSLDLICLNEGATVYSTQLEAKKVGVYGLKFILIYINKTYRLFYRPNFNTNEYRLGIDKIKSLIREDISSAFNLANSDSSLDIKRNKDINNFVKKLTLKK